MIWLKSRFGAEFKRLVATFGTFIASAGLGIANYNHAPIVGVIWALIWVFIVFFTIRPSRYDIAALEAALQAFYDAMDFPPNSDVRCAIYVDKSSDALIQLTAYIPGKRVSRKAPLNNSKGIVGRSWRMKEHRVELLRGEDFANSAYFQKYMVEKWGFTEEEARHIAPDRRAYLASPILDEKSQVIAVLYCDSNTVSVFENPETAEKAQRFMPFFRQLLKTRGG